VKNAPQSSTDKHYLSRKSSENGAKSSQTQWRTNEAIFKCNCGNIV